MFKLNWRKAAPLLFAALGLGLGFLCAPKPQAFAQPAQTAATCTLKEVRDMRAARIGLYSLDFQLLVTLPKQQLASVHEAVVCDDNLQYARIETPQGARLVRRFQLDLGANLTPPPCPCGNRIVAATEDRNASSSGLGGQMCTPVQC